MKAMVSQYVSATVLAAMSQSSGLTVGVYRGFVELGDEAAAVRHMRARVTGHSHTVFAAMIHY